MQEDLEAHKITKAVVDFYTAKTTKVYLRTRIDYLDVFGRPHWSEVCVVHAFGQSADGFSSCSIGGDVDTAKPSR